MVNTTCVQALSGRSLPAPSVSRSWLALPGALNVAANPVAPAAWVADCSRKNVSVLLPIWSSGTQLGSARGFAQIETENSSSKSCSMLFGRTMWLLVAAAPPGRFTPGPNFPLAAHQPGLSVADPIEASVPELVEL